MENQLKQICIVILKQKLFRKKGRTERKRERLKDAIANQKRKKAFSENDTERNNQNNIVKK